MVPLGRVAIVATPTGISVRAVVLGLVTFPIVYSVGATLANLIVGHPSESPGIGLFIAPIFAAVLWLLPGFTTGYIAKRSPLLHGFLLGGASVLLTLIILGVLEVVIQFSEYWPMAFVIGFLAPVFLVRV